jgi:allophanate hydrolase subunit 2
VRDFEFLKKGIVFKRGAPVFGMQHRGITPGGPMDRFSSMEGNILAGNNFYSPCLEIITAPVIKFDVSGIFVLTGAHLQGSFLERKGESLEVKYRAVYKVMAGDTLTAGEKTKGFRSYLCFREGEDISNDKIESVNFLNVKPDFSWYNRDGFIRVMEGPEFRYLENEDDFFSALWKISPDSNDMGMRLISKHAHPEADVNNMISDAVADGTIQLTPSGPIILMRHRQTLGGYPRIFNCISADIDLLAQFMPGQVLKFMKTDFKQARSAAAGAGNFLKRLADETGVIYGNKTGFMPD